MVLGQIYISSANGGVKTNYFMGALNGKYKFKLVATHYLDTGAGGNHKWIQLTSSKLNMSSGAQRYFIFINKADHVIQTHGELDFQEVDLLGGFIDIELIDLATGTQPANFGGCVFSFDIQPIGGQAP